MCLAATDYIGCVKAQSGFLNQTRIIVYEGVALAEVNAFPADMVYISGGTY